MSQLVPVKSSIEVKSFYEEASKIETKLINVMNVSIGPFDVELETQFQKVDEFYKKASQTVKSQPVEAQNLTKKYLQVQLLRKMVEQSDFQKLLIASVASTNMEVSNPKLPTVNLITEGTQIGSGRVSHNDKAQNPVATIETRVTHEDFNF